MGAEKTISITLSEELSESVRKAVESGPFGSPEAVVAAALHYWQDQRERDLAKLHEMIEEGLKGSFEPWEGAPAIIAKARTRRAERDH